MKTFTEYKEGTINFYNATVKFYNNPVSSPKDLEEIMLLSYALSKYIREKEASGVSNPRLTGKEQPINSAIKNAITFLDRTDVDPLVRANVMETLSRSLYAILKKSRY